MKFFKLGNILTGLFLIAVGIGYGGDVLNLWNFTIFFDGWWTLFIIVPCLCSILNHGYNTTSAIGVIIGVLLLLKAQNIININILKLLIPIILIIIGLKFIFRGRFFNKVKIKDIKTPNAPEYGAYFTTQTLNYNGLIFEGNNSNSIFGTLHIDLRGAIIPHDTVIEFNCIFGSINIIAPENIDVKAHSTSIFGGLSNKHQLIITDGIVTNTIYVTGTVIFGDVKIK